jgi:hypothetical protein
MFKKSTLAGEMPALGGATGWLNSPPALATFVVRAKKRILSTMGPDSCGR